MIFFRLFQQFSAKQKLISCRLSFSKFPYDFFSTLYEFIQIGRSLLKHPRYQCLFFYQYWYKNIFFYTIFLPILVQKHIFLYKNIFFYTSSQNQKINTVWQIPALPRDPCTFATRAMRPAPISETCRSDSTCSEFGGKQ